MDLLLFITLLLSDVLILLLAIPQLREKVVSLFAPKKEENAKSQQDQKRTPTKELIIRTLKQMNVNPQEDENGNSRLLGEYQGQYFWFIYNESIVMTIYYPSWYEVSLLDINKFSCLTKAINTLNSYSSVTTHYIIDKEEDTVRVNSDRTVIFPETLPDLSNYMEYLLHDFFDARNRFTAEMERLMVQQQSLKEKN